MPGLMLEDIVRQLRQHSGSERLRKVLDEVPRVRKELGYPPLVAPIRSMIATQAVFNVIGGDRYATVTQELKDYLQGLYGRPPAPVENEVRRHVLGREEPITIRPADLLEPQVADARTQLKKMGLESDDDAVLTYVLFPSLALRFFKGGTKREKEEEEPRREEAKAAEPTPEAAAAPAPDQQGPAPQQAEFEVEVEGEVFKVRVSGAGMAVTPAPAGGGQQAQPQPQRAQAKNGAVVAPMQGLIVKIPVKAGDQVNLGDVVAVLEAMKMQNDIVSTVAGKVSEVYVKEGDVVSPNQALLTIAP
jgi:pyruvate carboxylase subunit B